MSWITGKSVITYADLYTRTNTLGGSTYTLKPGGTLTNSKRCIKVTDALNALELDTNYIPTGLPSGALGIRNWIQPQVVEQTTFGSFVSPGTGWAIGNYIYYPDLDLSGVVYFDPRVITSGEDASFISIPSTDGVHTNSRVSGSYYHPVSNRLYVNSFYGGGMTVIDCSTNNVLHTITYGSNGDSTRGNIYYVEALNEIWALGNGGSIRINATTESVVSSGFTIPTGTVYVTTALNKVYLVNDDVSNSIEVYNNSLAHITSISNLCQNTSTNGHYVSRGYYNDSAINPSPKIYLGEFSTTGGVTIVDTSTDTIITRVPISAETKTYTAVSVIAYHPIRNSIYIGGSILNNSTDRQARLWVLDNNTDIITSTITPSTNLSISGILYYSPNSSVYIDSSETTGSTTRDGVVFQYN